MAMTEESASGMTLYQFGAFATDLPEKTLRITVSRNLNDPWNDSQVWLVAKMWDSYNTEEDYSYMRKLFDNMQDSLGITEINKTRGIYALDDQQMLISFIDELFNPL